MTNHKHSLEKLMKSPRNLPWLAGAVVACAVLAAPAARAQTITTTLTAPTSSAGTTTPIKSVPQGAGAIGPTTAPLPSTTAPEAIASKGSGTATTTVSIDPAGGIPVVELYFDLTPVTLTGAKSLQAYHTTGMGRITRQLAANDVYVATLPIWTTNAAGQTSYYTMTATFTMAFNTTTNVLTSLAVALGDYVAPATAGGVAIGGTIQ